ncbi:hypothetical protein ASZ90_018437 [hydrocarbon metagenome]|uniref:Uncharacterized protein n=1 Tax=hydrocarbon metagenome TaxID=938273 RepID=A0A0W8E6X8_9ZZZZ
MSKFDHIDGQPDEDQVLTWTEEFFFSLLNVLNAFFSNVDIKDAAERMSLIPFDQLVLEQLTDESDAIKTIATTRVTELAEMEVSYLRAYSD